MSLVADHLRRLTDFSGRENRRSFWLWMLFVLVGHTFLGAVVSVPLSLWIMTAMQPAMAPGQDYQYAPPEVALRHISEAMLPVMWAGIIVAVLSALLFLALVAAAVTRRLHDGDRSGWYAVSLPVVQVAAVGCSLALLPDFFDMVREVGTSTSRPPVDAATGAPVPLFVWAAMLGLVAVGLTVWLLVLLARRGTAGPNRYGPDPLLPQSSQPEWQAAPSP